MASSGYSMQGVLGLAVLMLAWHNIWMTNTRPDDLQRPLGELREVADGKRALSTITAW